MKNGGDEDQGMGAREAGNSDTNDNDIDPSNRYEYNWIDKGTGGTKSQGHEPSI